MTTLKVYDTVLEAKYHAVNDYYIIRKLGAVIKFKEHPYQIKVNNDCYVYAANNPRYLLGIRVNKIEDYTTCGISDMIKMCVR